MLSLKVKRKSDGEKATEPLYAMRLRGKFAWLALANVASELLPQ